MWRDCMPTINRPGQWIDLGAGRNRPQVFLRLFSHLGLAVAVELA